MGRIIEDFAEERPLALLGSYITVTLRTVQDIVSRCFIERPEMIPLRRSLVSTARQVKCHIVVLRANGQGKIAGISSRRWELIPLELLHHADMKPPDLALPVVSPLLEPPEVHRQLVAHF